MVRGAGPASPSRQVELRRPLPQNARGGLPEKALPRVVEEAQLLVLVESEDGHVDLLQDPLEKRRRFDRVKPLLAKGGLQLVGFLERQRERSRQTPGHPGASGNVALA